MADVKTKATPIPIKLNLEGMGVAISETIALKQYMLTIETEMSDLSTQITANTKETQRLENLKEQTRELGKQRTEKKAELAQCQLELNERTEKLNQSKIQIPINDPAIVRGSVRM